MLEKISRSFFENSVRNKSQKARAESMFSLDRSRTFVSTAESGSCKTMTSSGGRGTVLLQSRNSSCVLPFSELSEWIAATATQAGAF